MSTFTKRHLTHEIFRILPVFSQFLWTLTFIFSGPHQKLSLVLLQKTNYIYSPIEKCKKKKNAMLFILFWYKVFVHSILKLLNFLVDSVLNYPREPSVYLLREELGDVENISRKNTSDITKLSYQTKNRMLTAKTTNKQNKTSICINLDQSSRLGKEILPKVITESSTTALCKVIGQPLNLMLP